MNQLPNLADLYDDEDSEPTIKIQMPTFTPQVVVDDRPTIPAPPPSFEEKTYPGVGLLISVVSGVLFWTAIYFIFR